MVTISSEVAVVSDAIDAGDLEAFELGLRSSLTSLLCPEECTAAERQAARDVIARLLRQLATVPSDPRGALVEFAVATGDLFESFTLRPRFRANSARAILELWATRTGFWHSGVQDLVFAIRQTAARMPFPALFEWRCLRALARAARQTRAHHFLFLLPGLVRHRAHPRVAGVTP